MRPEDSDGSGCSSLLDEVEEKQEQLDSLLKKLSYIAPESDYERVKQIGGEMCDIYGSTLSNGLQFRHQYHYFLEMLQSIRSPDLIDALMANLKVIIDDTNKKNGDKEKNALPKLIKLYDHISIDVVRMTTMENSRRTSFTMRMTKKDMDELHDKVYETQDKVESLQLETVAILGVFAAIVVAFAGGLDVIGGALSNLGAKDFPLILFSVSLTGLILFDVIWLLMECVFRIVKGRTESVVHWAVVAVFNALMIMLMCIAYWQMQ